MDGNITLPKPSDRKPTLAEPQEDTASLRYPLKKQEMVTYDDLTQKSSMDLANPSNMSTDVDYDPESGFYIYRTKIGEMEVSTPFVLSEDEYREHALRESMNKYWSEKAKTNTEGGNKFTPGEIQIGLGKQGEKIFGPGGVQLKTPGSVELPFGFTITKRKNPAISERNRKNTTFDFDCKIQMSAT